MYSEEIAMSYLWLEDLARISFTSPHTWLGRNHDRLECRLPVEGASNTRARIKSSYGGKGELNRYADRIPRAHVSLCVASLKTAWRS